MFKAIHTLDNQEIIILDPEWEDVTQLNALRDLDRRDLLICQECRQPVRVRAGEERQWHFAHKQRQNCTYQSESAPLLHARATLYRWLVEKFGADQVALEHKMEDLDFPRPIDVWVRGEKGSIAYWIIDTGIKTDIRETLYQRFQQLGVHIQWVFTTSMLREQEEPGRITLTTTERELMTASRYDVIYEPRRGQGRSLHYLDGSSATLISFRGLHLVHSPHTFAGCKITHPLRDMQILRQSGGFVHPDEHALLAAYPAETLDSATQSTYISGDGPRESTQLLPIIAPASPASAGSSHRLSQIAGWSKDAPRERIVRIGTCIFCSQQTTDYWSYDGATKTCRCRPCRDAGRE